jgi:hypothetical protein
MALQLDPVVLCDASPQYTRRMYSKETAAVVEANEQLVRRERFLHTAIDLGVGSVHVLAVRRGERKSSRRWTFCAPGTLHRQPLLTFASSLSRAMHLVCTLLFTIRTSPLFHLHYQPPQNYVFLSFEGARKCTIPRRWGLDSGDFVVHMQPQLNLVKTPSASVLLEDCEVTQAPLMDPPGAEFPNLRASFTTER